ncbi:MAG: carboxylating nicotinate-nucleotide diphosphorylase [Syntrophales bacterium]
MWPRYALKDFIRNALTEDVGSGDITTNAVLTGRENGSAAATAKDDLVLAGIEVFGEVFLTLDPTLIFTPRQQDGTMVAKGEIIAEISGSLASILTAERVALNLLQRMCGIATMTRRFVEEAAGSKARIIDTRKTVPGLRALDKYAVRVGGGFNHRFALYDGVLLKDNHIASAGGITPAIRKAREFIPHTLKIEVEVKDIAELEEALLAGADSILLDNMDVSGIAAAVGIVQGRVPLEASGNMTLERICKVAETGVDFISVGALTHSVQAADISLNITATPLLEDKSATQMTARLHKKG